MPALAYSVVPDAHGVDPHTTTQPYAAASPISLSRRTPNAVVVDLHTDIVIPDYDMYYSVPIRSFRPSYIPLADGSLVATPLIDDVRNASIYLAIVSALAAFFLMNSFTTAQFIRRGKIKKKGLLYILFSTQVLGVLAMLVRLFPFYSQYANCRATTFVTLISTDLSYSLLLTGILGTKAYRCLNNSWIVLLVLTVLQTTNMGLMVLALTRMEARRRLSGSCLVTSTGGLMPFIAIVQAVESVFICSCFVFAVWKASRSSGRGRLSVHLSESQHALRSTNTGDVSNFQHGPRGWWDYVPEASQSAWPSDNQAVQTPGREQAIESHGIMQFLSSKVCSTYYLDSSGQASSKSPAESGRPSQPPYRKPSVTFSVGYRHAHKPKKDYPCRASVVPSMASRVSKYMPRMQLFKEVLKNELCYTAFITVIFLILAIVMVIGANRAWLLSPAGWLGWSWMALSILTIHSFGRVVRRHEREDLLHHPSTWDPVYRAELEASRAFARDRRSRRSYSPISVASRRPLRAMSPDSLASEASLSRNTSNAYTGMYTSFHARHSSRFSSSTRSRRRSEDFPPFEEIPEAPPPMPEKAHSLKDIGPDWDHILLPSLHFDELATSFSSTSSPRLKGAQNLGTAS